MHIFDIFVLSKKKKGKSEILEESKKIERFKNFKFFVKKFTTEYK